MRTVRQRQAESWREYLAAAQWLDAGYGAGTGADPDDEVRVEVAQLRSALARQRAELAGRARSAASSTELARAAVLVTGDPASLRRALRHCRQLVRQADLHLGHAPRHAGRWRPARSLLASRWRPPRSLVTLRTLLATVSVVLLLAVA